MDWNSRAPRSMIAEETAATPAAISANAELCRLTWAERSRSMTWRPLSDRIRKRCCRGRFTYGARRV